MLLCKFLGCKIWDLHFFPSTEYVGGIIYRWNLTSFHESSRFCHPMFFVIRSSWIAREGHEGLIYIYALIESLDWSDFFDSLVFFISSWGCSEYIIFGDFNAIVITFECRGSNGFGTASDDLVNFVKALELQDLPLLSSSFTFFSSGPSGGRSRLDHSFNSVQAGSWCHQVVQKALLKIHSDHISIVLQEVSWTRDLGHSDSSTCSVKTLSYSTWLPIHGMS